MLKTVKKGTLLEVTHSGTKYRGVVGSKRKNKCTVNLGMQKGGMLEGIQFSEGYLMSNSTVLSLNDFGNDAMSEYDIKSYKTMDSYDGYTMSCKITKNGKAILSVSNGGHGGCNDYYSEKSPNETRPLISELKRKAVQWSISNGDDGKGDCLDLWVEWLAECKQYGTPASIYLV